jgi:hypothetical protein
MANLRLVVAAVAMPLSAQLSSVVVSTTNSPRSLVVAGRTVICSLTTSAQQVPVDVSVPTNPVVGVLLDPPLGDQFGNAAYTPSFGGRLVLGHRSGGMNLIDTSRGSPLTTLFTSQPGQPAKYLHEGLETHTAGGRTFVAYSEHNVGNSGGGLRLLEILSTSVPGDTLVEIGSDILVGRDGNGLEISADGRHVWQLGWSNNNTANTHLAVWDTQGWTAPPQLVTTVPYPVTTSYYSRVIERNGSGDNLVAALGFDGLAAVDVRTPTSPLMNVVLVNAAFFFEGVRFLATSNLCVLWGFVRVGTADVDFLAFADGTTPGVVVPILVVQMPMQIADVGSRAGRLYVLGRDRASLATTLSIF